ncbi:MAG: T9SS type A sorting domain-containing protein [Mariniphaga sp.]|nr:T9SS type A sorting domain-containing protein [Mariniphaga sp.]
MHGYADELYCDAFTNLAEGDLPVLTPMHDNEQQFAGYWGGTNSLGFEEYVEKFSIPGDEILEGISLGVARIVKNSVGADSYVTIKVYNGNQMPENQIYSKDVLINDFVQSAMNYISFDEVVEPSDTFFVGFNVTNIHENVTFALYHAERNEGENALYLRKNGNWIDFRDEKENKTASLAFELIACNVSNNGNDTIPIIKKGDIHIYPNPAKSILNLQTTVEISSDDISVFDLMGRELAVHIIEIGSMEFKIHLPEVRAGIYIIRVKNNTISESRKFYNFPY